MIRIDEIYNNTFWPWINRHRPGSRVFFCDPFGHTGPQNLYNFGHDNLPESDFIFFHDQEPVNIEQYRELFAEVMIRNLDMVPAPQGKVVVSEIGEKVDLLCSIYGWTPYYYFFHGWAALDWYRGYDRTWLIARYRDRRPAKTFFSPNRIIGGDRNHRVLFLYHVFRNSLQHNNISAPRVCPHEQIDILEQSLQYQTHYPDIHNILEQAELPQFLPGETTHVMSSCWLDNFDSVADSMVYVPTETVYFGRRLHLTEKTFKAIALEMPFVLVAPANSLCYLRRYGFRTFDTVWDESYDLETDDLKRLEKVTALLAHLDQQSPSERLEIKNKCTEIVEHNFRHFYGGGFEEILWKELQHMLDSIETAS